MHRYRSHTCGALRESNIDQTVRLSGWCHRIRDHGGLLFIDLRDHYGLTQCVVDPDSPAFKDAEKLRSEWVVRIDGKVRRRPEGTDNPDLPTGAVELYVSEIEVLGPAGELPLPVFGEQEYPEDIRLKYRFLDLRRDKLHQNIMTRGAIVDSMRKRMKEQGFFEFQTPILTASSPEGARDFLVPSRIHPGKFYALPQAPQQYKQLLMMSGFDRYFQIAPCFRDEDPRADRLPGEFYQLDVEMSFVTQDDVFAAIEPVITGVFEDFAKGKPVTRSWPRIPFAEALRKYGSDKPDLRNPIEMQDVSEQFRGSGFKVFARMLEDPKNQVWAIPGTGGGSRAFCDRMNSWAQGEGQPGLGYIMWREGGEGAGPLANNIGPERTAAIRAAARIERGRCRVLRRRRSRKILEICRPRPHQARRRVEPDRQGAVRTRLDRRFPDVRMQRGREEDRLLAQSVFDAAGRSRCAQRAGPADHQGVPVRHHLQRLRDRVRRHPQSSARGDGEGVRDRRLWREMSSSASAACSAPSVRRAAAWRHGAGVDRIVMLLCGTTNLREISLFPMNQRAEDLLMGAPSEVTPKQLRELHIRLNLPQN